jgi:hypothetical protein
MREGMREGKPEGRRAGARRGPREGTPPGVRKGTLRRRAGWVALALVVLAGCAGAVTDRWPVAVVAVAVLVSGDVALALDHRVRLTRAAQAARATLTEQRALRDDVRALRRTLAPLAELADQVQERDRRLLAAVERERLAAADRDVDVVARLEALQRAVDALGRTAERVADAPAALHPVAPRPYRQLVTRED